jgi:Protein of unknown function (DUF2752)
LHRYQRGLALLAVATVVGLAVTNHFVCPFAAVTGFPCPGCGMTRALLALVRGDWREAWRQHPVSFLVPPLVITLCGFAFRRWQQATASGRRPRGIELLPNSVPLWGGLCLLLLVVWTLRTLGIAGEPAAIPHVAWTELLRLR